METLVIHEPYIRKLREKARRWGGDIIKVPDEEYRQNWKYKDTFSDAPFTMKSLGVQWGKKLIVLAGPLPDCAELVHEMAHTFACPNTPAYADEYDFLGWEYAMMRHCRFPMSVWHEFMRSYTVQPANSEEEVWSNLELEDRNWVLNERLDAARKLGLLTEQNVPKALR